MCSGLKAWWPEESQPEAARKPEDGLREAQPGALRPREAGRRHLAALPVVAAKAPPVQCSPVGVRG